jgi:hypothetical protein
MAQLSWASDSPLSPVSNAGANNNMGGSNTKLEPEHTALVGTTFYRSPEMEEGTSGYYTDKVPTFLRPPSLLPS